MFALGTAQLGMSYGVANVAGRPSATLAAEIVAAALEGGVRCFDTAQAYGDSEAVLGQALAAHRLGAEARIVTKLPPDLAELAPAEVKQAVRASLDRLGVAQVAVLMLHREDQLPLLDGPIGHALLELQAEAIVGAIGVSAYAPARALLALAHPAVTAIQIAANLFDRRIVRSGVVLAGNRRQADVFIRSIYLQGLALLPLERVPEGIAQGRQAVGTLQAFCAERGLSPKAFALGYARCRFAGTTQVIGAETPEQLQENLALFGRPLPDQSLVDDWDATWPLDLEELVNPSLWQVKR
jgi:aryl-alcohol dehydrogenase-like predicted oxidoreductase